MKITSAIRAVGMSFAAPKQYMTSNDAHLVINTNAVNQFLKLYSPLTNREKVLDFGCGTGESTLALAQGELGHLGKPREMVGVDISKDMIEHCKSSCNSANLRFEQLDVETPECQAFCSSQGESYDLVTSFSCLHWVPNQPAAVGFFNRILKPGGKFIFVICSTLAKDNVLWQEYEKMKAEARWAPLLKNTSWPHFQTVHRNNGWMSTVDASGIGPVIESDYVNLLKSFGFKIASSSTLPLKYVLHNDFTKNFFKSNILTAFPQLQGVEREEFFTEYIRRLKAHKASKINDRHQTYMEGIQIFGEKVRDF